MRAIDTCTLLGVEANVRYMPPCQLPGYEQHVYTGFQLPYDPTSGTTTPGTTPATGAAPSSDWYYQASRQQQQRHHYAGPRLRRLRAARRSATASTPSTPPAGAAAKPCPTPGPLVTDPLPLHPAPGQDRLPGGARRHRQATEPDRADGPAGLRSLAARGGGAGARRTRSRRGMTGLRTGTALWLPDSAAGVRLDRGSCVRPVPAPGDEARPPCPSRAAPTVLHRGAGPARRPCICRRRRPLPRLWPAATRPRSSSSPPPARPPRHPGTAGRSRHSRAQPGSCPRRQVRPPALPRPAGPQRPTSSTTRRRHCAAMLPAACRPRRRSWSAMTPTPGRRWTRWPVSTAPSRAIPRADVFHQSSRFEPRPRSGRRPRRLRAAVCDCRGTARQPVRPGFELPRLLNRSARSAPSNGRCARACTRT